MESHQLSVVQQEALEHLRFGRVAKIYRGQSVSLVGRTYPAPMFDFLTSRGFIVKHGKGSSRIWKIK